MVQSALTVLSIGVVLAAPTVVQSGLLPQPPVVHSRNGVLSTNIVFDVSTITNDALAVQTFTYNGTLPGPTLRVRPGDLLEIDLVNALNLEPGHARRFGSGFSANVSKANTFRFPNSTNLHTHGLHVSPEGQGDNVFSLVGPKESRKYVYQLPSDHSPGTFWYHPHLHGSTALQVGGGAAGVIIVEDPPGSLPKPYREMPERIIMLQNMPVSVLKSVAEYSRGAAFRLINHSATLNHLVDKVSTANTNETNVALINGAYRPILEMKAGKWERWRIVNAAAFYFVDLTLDGCELKLLQKDGVYLSMIPREVSRLVVPTGGRVDVAVRCRSGRFIFASGLHPGRSGAWNGNLYRNEHIAEVVVMEAGPQEKPLPQFIPPRPNYLRDLRNATVFQSWDMNMTPYKPLDSAGQTMFLYNGDDGGACKMNTFVPGESVSSPWKPIHKMQVNTIEEWKIGNLQGHPFHLHVNHFQIVDVDDQEFDYAQKGDWYDTLEIVRPSPTVITRCVADTQKLLKSFDPDSNLVIASPLVISQVVLGGLTWGGKSPLKLSAVNGINVLNQTGVIAELQKIPIVDDLYDADVALKFKPSDGMYGFATIRVLADRYSGQAVMHCHFLNHEDMGCIATTTIETPSFFV